MGKCFELAPRNDFLRNNDDVVGRIDTKRQEWINEYTVNDGPRAQGITGIQEDWTDEDKEGFVYVFILNDETYSQDGNLSRVKIGCTTEDNLVDRLHAWERKLGPITCVKAENPRIKSVKAFESALFSYFKLYRMRTIVQGNVRLGRKLGRGSSLDREWFEFPNLLQRNAAVQKIIDLQNLLLKTVNDFDESTFITTLDNLYQ